MEQLVIIISVPFLYLPATKENIYRENFYSLLNYKPKITVKSKPRPCSKVTVIKRRNLDVKSLRLHEIKKPKNSGYYFPS